MSVSSDMGRILKKIVSNLSRFTAEQLKNWTIVYSLYALRGLISQDEYHCWQAFVLACYFICRRIVLREDIEQADLLLLNFCRHTERLYLHIRSHDT